MPPAQPLNVTGTPSKQQGDTESATPVSGTPLKKQANHGTTNQISSPHELTVFVDNLLEQLEAKFDDMSAQILRRMEQMSTRVDALEASIQDIINGDVQIPSVPPSPAPAIRRSGSSIS